MTEERKCISCRVCFVAALLLALAGGIAVGAYFAVTKKSKTSSGETSNDEAETEESGRGRGANFHDRNKPINRDNRFYALSYSPFGLGDNLLCPPWKDVGGLCLISDQVTADMRQISSMTSRLKTYSLNCEKGTRTILDYAKANGMEVMLGVWVSDNDGDNKAELGRLDKLMASYARSGVIKDILVGNEAIFIQGASVSQLIGMLKSVRSIANGHGSSAKIGTAEIYNVWAQEKSGTNDVRKVDTSIDMSDVVKASDWIGLNTHPYYGGVDPISGEDRKASGKFILDSWRGMQDFWSKRGFKNVSVLITETGFPSKGKAQTSTEGTAKPSVRGIEIFAAEVEQASRDNDMPVYYFEPYDGDWKRRWLPATDADYCTYTDRDTTDRHYFCMFGFRFD